MAKKKVVEKAKTYAPLNGQVLIKQFEAEPMSETIIVPQGVKNEKPSCGKVLATAEDVTSVEAGQTVFFPKFVGVDFSMDGEKVMSIKATELLGKMI